MTAATPADLKIFFAIRGDLGAFASGGKCGSGSPAATDYKPELETSTVIR